MIKGQRLAKAWRYADSAAPQKKCCDCGDWYELDSFYFDNQKGRYRAKCKQCTMQDVIRRKRKLKDASFTLQQVWREW